MQLKIDKCNYLKRRNFWIAKNITNKQTKNYKQSQKTNDKLGNIYNLYYILCV